MQINISWSTLCFIKDKILLVKERILFGRKTVSRAWKNVPRGDSIHESGHVNITLPSSECCGRWKFAFPGIECSDQVLISRTWTHPWARPRKTRFWVLPLSPFLYYLPLYDSVWWATNFQETVLLTQSRSYLFLVNFFSYKSKLPLQYYQR